MGLRLLFHLFLLTIVFPVSPPSGQAQEQGAKPPSSRDSAVVVDAVMCEAIQDFQPRNSAVVFSAGIGRVYCLTTLERITERSFVYHNWYYRDALNTRIRLALRPPRWSVYSTIQLRETDIGPWRVEVTDPDGHVLHILRFSVTH